MRLNCWDISQVTKIARKFTKLPREGYFWSKTVNVTIEFSTFDLMSVLEFTLNNFEFRTKSTQKDYFHSKTKKMNIKFSFLNSAHLN